MGVSLLCRTTVGSETSRNEPAEENVLMNGKFLVTLDPNFLMVPPLMFPWIPMTASQTSNPSGNTILILLYLNWVVVPLEESSCWIARSVLYTGDTQ